MRADQWLVEQGVAATRSQAQRLIAAGVRWRLGPTRPWQTIGKNGEEVPASAEWQLQDAAELRYVSRGGLKLEAALQRTGVDVRGRVCLDVGQSTGGFTDCLLQAGARQVVGIDVGHDQLQPRLRLDARVCVIERFNARELSAERLQAQGGAGAAGPFDLIVGDVSFISQTLIWPGFRPLLADGGQVLMLVKPQFELQPEQIGRGGLVRDPAGWQQAERRLREAAMAQGFAVLDYFDSPITGGDGNREFFIWARP